MFSQRFHFNVFFSNESSKTFLLKFNKSFKTLPERFSSTISPPPLDFHRLYSSLLEYIPRLSRKISHKNSLRHPNSNWIAFFINIARIILFLAFVQQQQNVMNSSRLYTIFLTFSPLNANISLYAELIFKSAIVLIWTIT